MEIANDDVLDAALFDEDGLLINTDDWNASLAREIARHYGIPKLDDDHWRVIEALRLHYQKFGVAPAMYNICRSLGKDPDLVHSLFLTCLNAWRVAGLPNPGEEAKSYLSDM